MKSNNVESNESRWKWFVQYYYQGQIPQFDLRPRQVATLKFTTDKCDNCDRFESRDCWNIVVRQGPIPWFDLWAGSGPWGKSSTSGWEGKRSLFAATQQRKPSQSSALLAIQCKYDGKIITAWLKHWFYCKNKKHFVLLMKGTPSHSTIDPWSLLFIHTMYTVKLKGLRLWDARLSFQFKTLMISFSSSIENKIKRLCNGFKSRLFKIWLKPVLFSNLVDSGTCQATIWPLAQTTLVHLGVTNVTFQTFEMRVDA